jgi:hypothetical protein
MYSYPWRSFRSQLDDFDCPHCRNDCNCDICCRKRGEDYISFRESSKSNRASAPIPAQSNSNRSPTPTTPEADLCPLPEKVDNITGPLSFWGTIYKSNGAKFANGFALPGDKIIFASVIDGPTTPAVREPTTQGDMGSAGDDYVPRRVYAGAYQPSWRLGNSPKEVRKQGDWRDQEQEQYSTGSRWFVGKRRLLDWPVVAYTRDLPAFSPLIDDSSPLSSLSDDSDIEVNIETPAALAGRSLPC